MALHAVMLPAPLQGHINPMLHLAHLLASSHGFSITFLNTEDNHNAMISKVPSHSNIHFANIPDGFPPEHPRSDPIELIKTITSCMPAFLHEFLKGLYPNNITCLICNAFLCFGQDVAASLNIPYVPFWTQSAASYASALLVTNGFRPPQDRDSSYLIDCIPGVPPLKLDEINSFLQCYDPDDTLFDLFTGPFKRIGEADSILINSFDQLEQVTISALREKHPVYTVGPLLPPSFFDDSYSDISTVAPAEADCLKWLDQHPAGSVLYVSYGTLAVLTAKQIAEIALGLEESQHPFLWVVRQGLMEGDAAVLPEGFLQRVKDRALIVPWAPQLQVLLHGAVGGFLTHCGWNSTLEGMSAGVAMLGYPSFSDQATNCKCVVEGWGAGLRLEAGEAGLLGRKEVEEKVKELMGGEKGKEMRKRAKQWRQAAKNSVVEHEGSSFMNLTTFVDSIKARGQTL